MIRVYTKSNCPQCDTAKNMMNAKGLSYQTVEIGVDITREEFMEEYPNVRSAPLIVKEDTPYSYNEFLNVLSGWTEKQEI